MVLVVSNNLRAIIRPINCQRLLHSLIEKNIFKNIKAVGITKTCLNRFQDTVTKIFLPIEDLRKCGRQVQIIQKFLFELHSSHLFKVQEQFSPSRL